MHDPNENAVREAAIRVFRTPQGADAFLTLRCPALGDTPRALVEAGRANEVLAFLDKLEHEAPPPPRTLDGLFGGWFRFGKR